MVVYSLDFGERKFRAPRGQIAILFQTTEIIYQSEAERLRQIVHFAIILSETCMVYKNMHKEGSLQDEETSVS